MPPHSPLLFPLASLISFFAIFAIAQQEAGPEAFSIFRSTGRLPSGCIDGYTAAQDEVLYNVPYTYEQVLSVIGSFANITWNGINSTTLNGSDNTVGTARSYQSYGIDLVETIKTYRSPVNGPYFEDHTLAPAYNPTANLSIYAPLDALTVTPICSGAASALNFTIDFCSTNVSAGGEILHDSHVFDATTLQEFLGNETWTGCDDSSIPTTTVVGGAAPSGTGSVGSTSANGTTIGGGNGAGPSVTPAAFTGGATTPVFSLGGVLVAFAAFVL
ncbi:MAG: hypothetical protein Q9220_004244 [cf. Caloplaca sp. 1 TL-2023]